MTYLQRPVQVGLEDVHQWNPTIEQTRDACLEGRILAMNIPSVPSDLWFKEFELNEMLPKVQDAVRNGRLIDCGHLPNEVIKIGGKRAGIMYNDGLLGHPFTKPWVLYHSWDQGISVYLVELKDNNPTGGNTEITELNPILLKDRKVLCAGDRVFLEPSSTPEKYQGFSRPSTWRYALRTSSSIVVAGAAMANCLDPFVTALLLMHTDGVPVDRIDPPIKLNKARIKAGKPPLPTSLRIVSGPYVTAMLLRKQRRRRGAPQDGTHASPVFHWRMGHWRYFQDRHQPSTALAIEGERGPWRIRVRDAVVNAKGEAREAFMRSHYVVKHNEGESHVYRT